MCRDCTKKRERKRRHSPLNDFATSIRIELGMLTVSQINFSFSSRVEWKISLCERRRREKKHWQISWKLRPQHCVDSVSWLKLSDTDFALVVLISLRTQLGSCSFELKKKVIRSRRGGRSVTSFITLISLSLSLANEKKQEEGKGGKIDFHCDSYCLKRARQSSGSKCQQENIYKFIRILSEISQCVVIAFFTLSWSCCWVV